MRMNKTLQDLLTSPNSSRISTDILIQKILLGSLLFSLSIFTIFGNLVVLYAIRTEKHLRTVSNLFILSLAFADLVVGFIVMPLSAANIITGRWPFSTVICQMWLSIDYVASTASIFNLILLSLDRYWAVVHPLLYLQTRSRRRAISFILIVWFISLLWAPAIIFWSRLIPEHSDILKPSECDTSFRSNKLFKTLTALVNFYVPLFTMIIISCRIMIAIRSRSTMEYGRRISSTARKQTKRDRTYTNASITHLENENNHDKIPTKCSVSDEQLPSVTIAENPSESITKNTKISFDPSDENTDIPINDGNDSLCQSPLGQKTSFCLSHIKPMKILFPSLASIKKSDKRKSEDLPRKYSIHKIMTNSFSVSNNMKYAEKPNHSKRLSRKFSAESSSSDECSHTTYINPEVQPQQQQPSKLTKKLSIRITTPSSSSISYPSHLENTSSIISGIPLTPPNTSQKMNIITYFDYIINPSRSRSLRKELKAARQLGLLVGVFTVTWLPYFILFLVVAWCQQCVSDTIFTASVWLGYLNSTFNPLIYPLCNRHFRRAFRKIFFCHHAKTKLPNLDGLRELHALHSIRYRR